MLAPTWRPNIAGKSSGIMRQRNSNDGFLESAFFRLYAEILEDRSLLERAKRTGYKLQFVLHPILAANVKIMRKGLSDRAEMLGISALQNDVVEVLGAGLDKTYDELIKECAVLVTDYSGIQFDVAYMMKQVVYFHNNEVPSQYDHGFMNYETMGFGPVYDSSSKVANELIQIIESRAKLPVKYQKRITEFFEHIDDQNCRRIFEDAAKFVGLGK
jgi:CDP-glycerol glycerophosphotransferase (TagB/SpsB family)